MSNSPSSFPASNHNHDDQEKENFRFAAIKLTNFIFGRKQNWMKQIAQNWSFFQNEKTQTHKQIYEIVWLEQQY